MLSPAHNKNQFWNKYELVLRSGLRFIVFFSVFLPVYFLPFLFEIRIYSLDSQLAQFMVFSAVVLISYLLYDLCSRYMNYWIDRIFFPERLAYKRLLDEATRRISKIKSPKRLFNLVIHFVTMALEVKNASVLIKDYKGAYRLVCQRGYAEREQMALALDGRNPAISFLENEKIPLDLNRMDGYLKDAVRKVSHAHSRYPLEIIREQLVRMKAQMIIPSFYGKELRSILIIGPKKSGSRISEKDLEILFHLSQDTAIAIENARLYDEALSKGKKLEQINRELHEASQKLIHALNETEETNKKLQDTQAQLLHEQKMVTLGRLASSVGHEINNPLTILSMNISRIILKFRKNPYLKVAEVLEVFKKIESNIQRIQAVVNTLTGLLRRHEKGTMKPLSLKIILEETLPLVRFQTYMDNLSGTDVDFDIPGNIPLIRGDLERLQEVFLNLFINSLHALQGRKNRKISVKAKIDPEDQKMIVITFSDNGTGMNDEIMKKIFNFRFTTKQEGKGSGIGLYMCRYIIEIHGGEIRVQSKAQEGTCFTITLPVYEEIEHAEIVNH